MVFGGKKQKQKAGDNSTQQQIETQNNFNVTNHIYNFIQPTEGVTDNATEENRREELTIEGCNTTLWKRTLGLDDKNVEPLRVSFLDARKNAEFLLGKIRKDFPNLTMHDITHVDSLWKVADVIIGDKYDINPLEGYVLGVAFLIHDAALSYDAVGGVDKLRDTVQWKDAYADGPGNQGEEEFKKECDFNTIRAIHAQKAEGILEETFHRNDGTAFYIIENDTFRTHFGKLIGEIAASHHWNIDDVESKFKNKKQINPMSWMPREWKINAQKLACILRCADAGHIDDGRAPDSIYRSLVVNGVSQQHWESQNHLCQVCEDDDDTAKLRITSSHPFLKKDFDAWNVAFDAVRLFDEELKKSNELLKRSTPKNSKDLSFPHTGISGAESKEALAKYIETDGWQPCSFGVHTSNVKALIENLGGSKLYGEENLLLVALRELIQNARDAIQARRTLDGRPEEGRITIRLNEEEGKRWIEVEDDGIGMSLDCIKNHLLDFGSSYWKSNMAKYENPGLWSKGFKSIGKFGIGFYSVFMVAKSVEVITKRYDKGMDDVLRIEFPSGLTLSPILSKATLNASLSTIVKFELKDDVDFEFKIIGITKKPLLFQKVLKLLVVGLDVNVYYNGSQESDCIHENIESLKFNSKKWLGDIIIPCPTNVKFLASKLEVLKDENGKIRGLILPPEYHEKIKWVSLNNNERIPCIKTIGGLLSSLDLEACYEIDDGYIGYIDGKEDNISRNKMLFDEPLKKCLHQWAKEKYKKNYNDIVINNDLAYRYHILMTFCGMINETINDNMRQLFSSHRFKINAGTLEGLLKIHLCLYSGVNIDAGLIKLYLFRGYDEQKNIMALIDSQIGEAETYQKLFKVRNGYYEEYKNVEHDKRVIQNLLQISQMTVFNYEEIIQKYCTLVRFHPFKYGNSRTLGIWVNLLLDLKHFNMIDWRKVDDAILSKLIRKKNDKVVAEYLKQYSSELYLTEITTTDENI